VWLSGGVEVDSPKGKIIRWSQPEIALYDDDPYIRMSYPDLVEEGGKYFLTETQKEIARSHEIDPSLLAGLWGQFDKDPKEVSTGLLLDLPERGKPMPSSAVAPQLPVLLQRSRRADYGTEDMRAGFSIELRTRLTSLEAGRILLDNRTPEGNGFVLQTAAGGTFELVVNDGRTESRWTSDPGMLQPGKAHHVVVSVDGGPKIVTFVIDGKLCDGGEVRQFGWGRFNPNLRSANGAGNLRIGVGLEGQIQRLRIYGRALRTSEAIRNFHAGSMRQ
jgi:hypothetical protein